jgi:hypothetical protein
MIVVADTSPLRYLIVLQQAEVLLDPQGPIERILA